MPSPPAQKQQRKRKQAAAAAAAPKRVIIIGGGMAGLAAARELQHRRYQVLLVEARQRVGGRVHGEPMVVPSPAAGGTSAAAATAPTATQKKTLSTNTSTAMVDLGGALIHGVSGNPLTKLCQQLGVPLTASLRDCLLLDSNGWPVDPKVDDRVSREFNDVLETTFERTLSPRMLAVAVAVAVVPSSTTSVGSSDVPSATSRMTDAASASSVSSSSLQQQQQLQDFGSLLDTVREEANITETPLWTWHRNNLELSCGAPLHKLGYAWNDDEPYGFEGDHVGVKTSWSAVTESLAEGLPLMKHSVVTAVRVVTMRTMGRDDDDDDHNNDNDNASRSARRGTHSTAPLPLNGNLTYLTPTPTTEPLPPRLPVVSTPTPATTLQPLPSAGRDQQQQQQQRRTSSRYTKEPTKFTITSHSALSYDNTSLQYHHQQQQHGKKRRTNAAASVASSSTKVLVELADGKVLQADAVVCTLPLGVLKQNTVTFDPPLSAAKQHAIDSLGCGLLNKCVLSFSTVFWQESDFLGLTADHCPYLILNGHTITAQPILIFMFGGNSAFAVEDKTDDQVMTECMQVLKTICKMIPPPPLDYVVTRWGQDPFSRMSFSYVPPGVQGMKERSILSEPIMSSSSRGSRGSNKDVPVVLFAGEHTTPFHPSTMHGAFLSGIREAYRLDLALEPKLNDSLTFESEFVYTKTFPLRRKFKVDGVGAGIVGSNGTAATATRTTTGATASARNASTGTSKNGINNRHRRHGIMTLRKRKAAAVPSSPAAVGLSSSYSTSSSPRKKSHRFTARTSMDEPIHQPTAAERTAQEDRTLGRAMQAYANWNVISQKVLPLYGSTKSTAALKHRYMSLRTSALHDHHHQQQQSSNVLAVNGENSGEEWMQQWLAEDRFLEQLVQATNEPTTLPTHHSSGGNYNCTTAAPTRSGDRDDDLDHPGNCRRSGRLHARSSL